jgi:predicted nucleotidyltransferase
MKLILENWNKFVNENTSEGNTQRVLDIANAFLNELGEGHIEAIYLIGSRASGEEKEDSDWDYLVVGDGFDVVEDEKIARAEEGNPFPGLDIDVATVERHKSLDIIFSSDPPKADQASKLIYPRDVK